MQTIDPSQQFLQVVCADAEAQILHLKADDIRAFQLRNVTDTLAKAKVLYESQGKPSGTVNPKVAIAILDSCANESQAEVQDLWAGLFVSAIADKPTDENLVYASILKQLCLHEARILQYMVENCKVSFIKNTCLPRASGKSLYYTQFEPLTDGGDIAYVQGLLTHMLSLRLNYIHWDHFGEVFRFMAEKNDYVIHLIPTTLGLNLYQRCIGYAGSITEYFKEKNNGL